jgi:hypothetical protein
MLSSVAKLADKAFVIGFLLPALLAVYTAINVFGCPKSFGEHCNVTAGNPFENLTYVALVVWFLAVLLLTLNHTAYRMLEGYLPPIAWLTSVQDYHRNQFQALTDERKRLRDARDFSESGKVLRELLAAYPAKPASILPTAFGNRIRAFESYATTVYGADSIPIWSRLGAVVPAAYQAQIGDARAQVDFFVNVLLLALVIACIAIVQLVREFVKPHVAPVPGDTSHLLIVAAIALAVAVVAYQWAVSRIGAWGELVKSAFDCYLPALAAQLGYELPDSESKRREFWLDVTRLFLYNDLIRDGTWTFPKTAPKSAAAAPGTHDGGDD